MEDEVVSLDSDFMQNVSIRSWISHIGSEGLESEALMTVLFETDEVLLRKKFEALCCLSGVMSLARPYIDNSGVARERPGE